MRAIKKRKESYAYFCDQLTIFVNEGAQCLPSQLKYALLAEKNMLGMLFDKVLDIINLILPKQFDRLNTVINNATLDDIDKINVVGNMACRFKTLLFFEEMQALSVEQKQLLLEEMTNIYIQNIDKIIVMYNKNIENYNIDLICKLQQSKNNILTLKDNVK